MAQIPTWFTDTLVAIGTMDKDNFRALATGFLVGYKNGQTDASGKDLYNIYLVTNRHVFEGKTTVWVRFNKDTDSHLTQLPLNEPTGKTWSMHPEPTIDIAVVGLNVQTLLASGIKLAWFAEGLILESKDFMELGGHTGDDVYVLGFPMGIAGASKNYPIVRHGTIARLDTEILSLEKQYYIDAAIYGGNSGGPVVIKPTMMSIGGTKSISNAYVIGVVKSVTMQQETLYSIKGEEKVPRMTLFEHSDLAQVVPFEYVREAVRHLRERIITLESVQAGETSKITPAPTQPVASI